MNITELLFNPSWWMVLLPFLGGFAVWWSGNKRIDKAMQRLGLGLVLVGLVWVVVSYAVQTNQEKVTDGTRQFVAAVVKRDQKTLGKLLHNKASLALWSRQDIIDGATSYAELYGLQSARILSVVVEEHPNEIAVSFTVFSEHDPNSRAMMPSVNSSWQFDWWDTSDGWKIKTITPLRIGNLDSTGANQSYFRGKPEKRY